jgi:hypothetical protein
MFTERPAVRTLMQGESVLIQQYCECLHWHNFVLFGPEQKAYYWEPLGKPLPGRSLIKTAFDAAAAEGWTLESITLELQADGHSCGDWAHYFRCRVCE